MKRCPYQGLVPYTEEDRDYFFGRDSEREIISANLQASRLTILYGSSGVGKSSVLRAGVVHDINHLAGQQTKRGKAPEFVAVCCQDWRDNPLAAIENALRAAAPRLSLQEGVPDQTGLRARLRRYADRLRGGLLLILDQFEEYLYYHGRPGSSGNFDDELAEVLSDRQLRVNVLLSLREDALAKLDQYKGRIGSIFDNYLRIELLDLAAARDAILKPVSTYCRMEGVPEITVEPALVEAVLEQVQPGKLSMREALQKDAGVRGSEGRIETPYLQLVLTRLWHEEMKADSRVLRRDTLRRLGESNTIVRNHLNDTMEQFSAGECEAAERIFFQLVTPSRTKIAHTVADLATLGNLEVAKVQSLVGRLAAPDCRILRTVPPIDDVAGAARFEIYHDALAEGILDWRKRYRAYLDQKRSDAERQEQLREQREELERRQERDRSRRLKLLLLVAVAVTLAFAGLASVAWMQKNAAELFSRKAQEAQGTAEKARTEAERASELAGERLTRIRTSLLIREATLSGKRQELDVLLGGLEQDHRIRFQASAQSLGYKNPKQQDVFQFRLFPEQASLPEGKEAVAFITYIADHPTFHNTLMTAGPSRQFAVSYIGWGCLSRIVAFIEYTDPERTPTIVEFNMCELIGW